MAPAAAKSQPRRRNKVIDLKLLDLDTENPRLVTGSTPKEIDLLNMLYDEESLDELMPSFVENGYFAEEPLVVVPNGQRFTVVEGNRRLATLKLLTDDRLRSRVRVAGWPKLDAHQRDRLLNIPCVVYDTRDEVLPFLGFRHITGAKKWAPFQKARFVNQLVESGQSLAHIQEVIGDTTSATRKLYQEYVVFGQLTEELDFPKNVIRERFSLLEVMLGQRPIKRFLAMPSGLPKGPVERVVPEANLDELLEVTRWVFGDGDVAPVVQESRDIAKLLAPVIGNEEALAHLRRTGSLEAAYDRTDGEQKFLVRKLARIEKNLQDVAGVLPLHVDDESVVDAVGRVVKLAASLEKQLP